MDRNNAVRVISRDTRDILGEGPLWSPIHHTLLWVDIFAPAIWRLDLASGAVQSWEAPERIGWVVEREARDDLIVVSRAALLRSVWSHLDLSGSAIRSPIVLIIGSMMRR